MAYKTKRTARFQPVHTKRIGVILSRINNEFFGDALDRIGQRISRDGYTVLLGQSFNDTKTEREVLLRLIQNQVNGLIVSTSNEILFDEVNVPVVLFNTTFQR